MRYLTWLRARTSRIRAKWSKHSIFHAGFEAGRQEYALSLLSYNQSADESGFFGAGSAWQANDQKLVVLHARLASLRMYMLRALAVY